MAVRGPLLLKLALLVISSPAILLLVAGKVEAFSPPAPTARRPLPVSPSSESLFPNRFTSSSSRLDQLDHWGPSLRNRASGTRLRPAPQQLTPFPPAAIPAPSARIQLRPPYAVAPDASSFSSASPSVSAALALLGTAPFVATRLAASSPSPGEVDDILRRLEERQRAKGLGTAGSERQGGDVDKSKSVTSALERTYADAIAEASQKEEEGSKRSENLADVFNAVVVQDSHEEEENGLVDNVSSTLNAMGEDDDGDKAVADDDPVRKVRKEAQTIRSMAVRAEEERVQKRVVATLKKNKNRRFKMKGGEDSEDDGSFIASDVENDGGEGDLGEECADGRRTLRMERKAADDCNDEVEEMIVTNNTFALKMPPNATTYENYDATLTKSNVTTNSNRFYRIRLMHAPLAASLDSGTESIQHPLGAEDPLLVLESSPGEERFYLITHWGRIGEAGTARAYGPFPSSSEAVEAFRERFRNKVGVEWQDRFNGREGKYAFLDLLPEDNNSREEDGGEYPGCAAAIGPASPLGRLSRAQIRRGLAVLDRLEDAISVVGGGNATVVTADEEEAVAVETILDLSSEFYTLVPHAFGRKFGPIFDDIEIVEEKRALLRDMLLDENRAGDGAVVGAVEPTRLDAASASCSDGDEPVTAGAKEEAPGGDKDANRFHFAHYDLDTDTEPPVRDDVESCQGTPEEQQVRLPKEGSKSKADESEDERWRETLLPIRDEVQRAMSDSVEPVFHISKEEAGQGQSVGDAFLSSDACDITNPSKPTTNPIIGISGDDEAGYADKSSGDDEEDRVLSDPDSDFDPDAIPGNGLAAFGSLNDDGDEEEDLNPHLSSGASTIGEAMAAIRGGEGSGGAIPVTVKGEEGRMGGSKRRRTTATIPASAFLPTTVGESLAAYEGVVEDETGEVVSGADTDGGEEVPSVIDEAAPGLPVASDAQGSSLAIDTGAEAEQEEKERAERSHPSPADLLAERKRQDRARLLEEWLPPANATFYTSAVAREANMVRDWAKQAKEERRKRRRRGVGGEGRRRVFATAEDVRARHEREWDEPAAVDLPAATVAVKKAGALDSSLVRSPARAGSNLWDLLAQKAVAEKRKEMVAKAREAASSEGHLDDVEDEEKREVFAEEEIGQSGQQIIGDGEEVTTIVTSNIDGHGTEDEVDEDDPDEDDDGGFAPGRRENDTAVVARRNLSSAVKDVRSFLRRRSVLTTAVAVVAARRMVSAWLGKGLSLI